MLVLCVQEWTALGPQSMPTNNLSLTLGLGREREEEEEKAEEGEEEKEEEEDETGSTRTKCPAQGREHGRRAIEGTERWRGKIGERDRDPEENTVSSLSFRGITLNIFLW